MKTNKYNYLRVIQQNYDAYGREDVSTYECNSLGAVSEMSGIFVITKTGRKKELTLLNADLKEYQIMGYPTRVIFRKELANV
jgi:hypothetical protein